MTTINSSQDNRASCRGIVKAGFAPVGELSFRADGSAGFRPGARSARVRVGAALLGVPLLDATGVAAEPLAPCWHCAIEAARRELPASAAACWDSAGGAPPCACAVSCASGMRAASADAAAVAAE